MTVPEASVAVELERLRGTVATGFARVEGSLAVLVERSDRNEREIDDLRKDVEALKKNRWPAAAVGMLTGATGAATGLLALFTR
ncbi:hypothetical protein [Streptomyces sp. NPDC048386]|uniref:hypothetical protein n=1 Tax=Streptomyces sp. NPDC048386 TaxID=3365541 RepID=UPI0037105DC4